MEKKGTSITVGGNADCGATMEIVQSFLKNLKMELLHDAEIPILGVCAKKPKTLIQKNMYTHMFIAVLFKVAKIWKQPQCLLVDEWI